MLVASHLKHLSSMVFAVSALWCLPAPAQNDIADEGGYSSIDSSVSAVLTGIASKRSESVFDAPGVITVLTHDEIIRFGGTTLADVLKRVPSLIGTTNYLTDRSVIAARGDQILPSSSHILLLLNGRPMREIMEGGIKSDVYESFPVNIIDRIEVIRGPGSVLYGSQAVSAVINILTKSPHDNTATVYGALGEGLRNNVSADARYTFGDLSLVFAGRYADKGGWNVDQQGRDSTTVYTINTTIPDYGPGMYGEISFKDLRLMCSYNEWSSSYSFSAIEQLKDLPEYGLPYVAGGVSWRKFFADAGYTFKPKEWYTSTVNATFTRSLLETSGFPWTSRDAFELLGEWTNFISPFQELNITAGGTVGMVTGTEKSVNGHLVDYNNGIYNKGHIGLNLCGYTQVDYRLPWVKIIGGIQGNKVRFTDSTGNNDNFKPDFNPRGGAIFYPVEHVNIKMFYSTAYRAPSIDELYLDYITISGKMTHSKETSGETGLDPEKVSTYDIGANYQDDRVCFGINAFHSRLRNLIVQYSFTPQKIGWENRGSTTILGLECEGTFYLTKKVMIEGSILYQQSEDSSTGELSVAPLPNFSAKGGLSYLSDDGLTIGIFNMFQQALDSKYWTDLNKHTKHFNIATLNCVYDLRRFIKVKNISEFSLVLNIDNLFDTEVWLPPWNIQNGFAVPYKHGRTIYGGFKCEFR